MSLSGQRGSSGWRLRPLAFAAVVALQVALVAGAVAREEYFLRSGEEIVLKSIPVDPRDLLRGDYVILRYEAEAVPYTGEFVAAGETAYVVFVQRGRYWEPVSLHRENESRSSRPEGSVVLRATVRDVGPPQGGPLRYVVEYGNLGRYYIPEGTGEPPSRPDVVVAVKGDGSTRIKRLEVDGRPWP